MINKFKNKKVVVALAVVVVALLAAAYFGTSGHSSTATSRSHARKGLTGVVTSIGPSNFVMKSRSGTKTITLESATKYVKHHARTAKSTLAVGERVRVRLVPGDSRATAAAISILASSYSGTVSALSSTGFTLTTKSGVTHPITILPTTNFRHGKVSASASSLQSGAKVKVSGTIEANGSMVASSVTIH